MVRLNARFVVTVAVLLAGAIVTSLILIDSREKDDGTKPELSLAYYLDEAELVGTGEDGAVLFRVWTDRAEQQRDNNSVELIRQRLLYGPPDQLPWELEARRGHIPPDAGIITLSGNVVARSGDEPENRTTIRTEKLDIYSATRQATTEEKVAIEYNGRILNATGMEADFEANRLSLLSNVNGKFNP